jgi:16S rRNA (uracil1498-N3)-methyltransferase
MGERRLFVSAEQLAGDRVTLTGAEHRHLARVLRARAGDALTLFDGRGGEVDAQILRVEDTETALQLGERRLVPTVATPTTLLTAVPRGPRMDFLVQKTTELGVCRLVPLLTSRSVARPDADKRARWERIAREAARQCGRADVPIVEPPTPLAVAIADVALPARRFALVERDRSRPLRGEIDSAPAAATALLVGPEGGLVASEVQAIVRAGFVPVGLGPLILRVETAGLVALALVAAAGGALD